MASLLKMVPPKYLVPIGALGALNKRIIFPAAKKVASKVSTSLGILSQEEAMAQEVMFDNLTAPINKIIDTLENSVIEILGGGLGIAETLIQWVASKDRDWSGTQIVQKESAPPQNIVSALGENVGHQKSDLNLQAAREQIKSLGGVKKIKELSKSSQVSSKNIDMSLFNAMEHQESEKQHSDISPTPPQSGAPLYA